MKMQKFAYIYHTWIPPYHLQEKLRNYEGLKMVDTEEKCDSDVHSC